MRQLEVLREGFTLIDRFYSKTGDKSFRNKIEKRIATGILGFLRENKLGSDSGFCSIPYSEDKTVHGYTVSFIVMCWYPPWDSEPKVKVNSPEGPSFESTWTEQINFKELKGERSLSVSISHLTAPSKIRNPALSFGLSQKYIDSKTGKILEHDALNRMLNDIWKRGNLSLKARRMFSPFSSEYTIIIPYGPAKDERTAEAMNRSLEGELCLYAIKVHLFDDLTPLYDFIIKNFVRPKLGGLEYAEAEEISQRIAGDLANTTYTYPSNPLSFLSFINKTTRGKIRDFLREQDATTSFDVMQDSLAKEEEETAVFFEDEEKISFRKKKKTRISYEELEQGVSVTCMAKILEEIDHGKVSGKRTLIYRFINKGLIKPQKSGCYTLYRKDFDILWAHIKSKKEERAKYQELINRLCEKRDYKDISGARKWYKRRRSNRLTDQQIEEEIELLPDRQEARENDKKDLVIDCLIEKRQMSVQEAEDWLRAEEASGASMQEIAKRAAEIDARE